MLYRLVLALRHLFYDKGWKKSFRAAVPTVCIGNVTVGGTGKTPFAEWVLRCLLQSDDWAYSNIAVLSRGYKRKKKGFQVVSRDGSAADYGDEPLQLARKFPSVTVAVDKDRVEGCRKLTEGPSVPDAPAVPVADIIVLDDAFQYRRLAADVNIVLVDYNRPVFKDKLMPWGRLRDLPSRLRKARLVVVTKCPAFLGDWDRQEWRRLLRLKDSQQLFFTTIAYGTPEPVFEEADARYTYSQRLVLVTGIANDAPLRSYLSDTYKISKRLQFPDHHKYTRADIRSVSAAVKEQPTACVMTTEKDAQRLRDVPKVPEALRQRLFYVPIRAEFLTPEEASAFTDALLGMVRR